MKIKELRKDLKKILNSGRSGDLDACGCAEYNPELVDQLLNLFTKTMGEEKELPDMNSPLGWIMTLNNQGELTVHMGSGLSQRIQKSFGVKHDKNVFVKK